MALLWRVGGLLYGKHEALVTAGLLAPLIAIAGLSGCAEGVPVPEASAASAIQAQPQPAVAGMMAIGAAGGTAAEPATNAPVFMGQACAQGEVVSCVCPDTGTEGIQRCLFDSLSPTNGALGPCMSCAAGPPAGSQQPEPQQPEPQQPGPEPEPAGCVVSECPLGMMILEPCCMDNNQCGFDLLGECMEF